VDKSLLWQKLTSGYGISGKFMLALQALYKVARCLVRINIISRIIILLFIKHKIDINQLVTVII